MTAEVAILNRTAVAIAADSAVTLGRRDLKVYNSANKLFALSALNPVAVMVYGAGSFGEIPWETIVKEYRRMSSSSSFDTIEDYASDFIDYLSSLVIHIPPADQSNYVAMIARWELDQLRSAAERAIQAAESSDTASLDSAIDDFLSDYADARVSELSELGLIHGLTDSGVRRHLNGAVDDWSEFVNDALGNIRIAERVNQKIRRMVSTSLRVASESPWSSGVVVAGFGEQQIFPALTCYVVDGVVAGKVRSRHLDDVRIGEDLSAAIRPFAQNDMVATFMDGLDPSYRSDLRGFVDETIELFTQYFCNQVEDMVSAEYYKSLFQDMTRARFTANEHFHNELESLVQKKNVQKIMSIVELLPKEELAEMAETLVNLTSFKRRVTPEAETVGGPIDVAVISKGDGLVWIKRKHYFPPDLNFRYFDRDRGFRDLTAAKGSTP